MCVYACPFVCSLCVHSVLMHPVCVPGCQMGDWCNLVVYPGPDIVAAF